MSNTPGTTERDVGPYAPYAACPPEIVDAMGGVVPTVQQWDAISQPMHAYAIVAGAGSGKTSLMAARIAYLTLVRLGRIEADHEGALPSEILGLTFTNKAAEHLSRKTRHAVAGLELPEAEEPTVMTYHAFGSILVQTYGLRLGLDPEASLLTEAQKWDLVAKVLESREFTEVEVRHPPYTTGLILTLADQCANLLVSPQEIVAANEAFLKSMEGVKLNADLEKAALRARQRSELAAAVADYRERKQAHDRIDYGDQIEHACRLAETQPSVGAELRERYRVVLLDEYQDTNVAQARLMRALFPPPFPVTAVGDPDQNIYAWRGASLTNLLEFPRQFGAGGPDGPAAAQLPLYVNFRSGSRILSVADAIIQQVPEERRAADKRLVPHASRGEGRVSAFLAKDQVAEAEQIATMIREEHDRGRPYGEMAILCRKKRLFRPIDEALRAADIPAEVVDVGGLLKAPEIVDLVAYLRVIADPSRNVALTRLLMGPRWRIGYRDLARLSAWSAENNYEFRLTVQEEDDPTPADTAFSLVEALEHLDEIEGLSDEGRVRLAQFTGELEGLRSRAGIPPAELAFAIVETTGLLAELDASPLETAAGIRQNVLAFLDHLAGFAPLAGEATLQTVLDYLDRAEEAEEDLEAVQPSAGDTVKLMTIHKAKGLEWDVVFVPGMAEGGEYGGRSSIFPDLGRDENPLISPSSVPFTLRAEFADFPDPREDPKAWRTELRRRTEEAERRNCYVALTRARDVLVCSAAYWYEGSDGTLEQPLGPGRFFKQIAEAEECELLFAAKLSEEEALPENNPLVAARAARAAGWPRPARTHQPDPVFAAGWRAAAEATTEPSAADELASSLPPGERGDYVQLKTAALDRVAHLTERDPTKERRLPPVPSALSVSGLETYARCPKKFYWSAVRPLPRRPSAAAALGTTIHRWIEQESRGQGRLLDLDAMPDLSTSDDAPPGDEAVLKATFKASRFAGAIPLFTERPFALFVDGTLVRGRIDAVYGPADGPWEVVDFKTGRRPSDDRLATLQLDVYALACSEIWRKDPSELTLTYYYLASNEEVTRRASSPQEIRERIAAYVRSMNDRQFRATPSEHCRVCDFLAFCPPGRAFVAQNQNQASS